MTSYELTNLVAAYHTMKATLEPVRIIIASIYGVTALGECYCDMSGRYERAGIKTLRMEYMAGQPRLSALAWLCLHALIIVGALEFFWRWWQPAIFMLGFTVFLGERVCRAFTAESKSKG